VPMNVNMTPGEYWIGAVLSSATTYTGTSNGFTIFGNSLMHNTGAIGIIGSSTSAGRDVMLLQGIYSTTTSAMPASIANTQVVNTVASHAMRANFYNVIYNATY